MNVADVPMWFEFEKVCDSNTVRTTGVKPYLPDGWVKFGILIDGMAAFMPANTISIKYNNGVLYIVVEAQITTIDEILRTTVDEIYRRIAQTIMMDSARTCMVCGKRGSRRKGFGGQPPLCREHFLEYINTIEV